MASTTNPVNNTRSLTFQEAEEYYESKIAYQSGKYEGVALENNTRLVKRGNSYAVKLHNTYVVVLHPDGSSEIRAGGWRTVTTKNRINKYSPHARITQKNYAWYINGSWESGTPYERAKTWTSGYGNVRFSPNGTLDTENEKVPA